MRRSSIAIAIAFAACGSPAHRGAPDGPISCAGTTCPAGDVCRYDTCIPPPAACASGLCDGDACCDTSANECLPYGVGPCGANDSTCKSTPVPGVFFPGVQCEWLGPPAGDKYPDHKNVLGTPMVANVAANGEISRPAIVFVSYNFTDGGAESCEGTNPAYFGVIRVIDGRTCEQLATIDSPTVVASASVALADIGGYDIQPEIIAETTTGGLAAWSRNPATGSWDLLWNNTSTIADNFCDWSGPSVHDLDDDGVPEIISLGNVYDAHGNVLTEQFAPGQLDPGADGYIPVVADVDGDGAPELVTNGSNYVRVLRHAGEAWSGETIAGASRDVAAGDLDGDRADELLILGDRSEIVKLGAAAHAR